MIPRVERRAREERRGLGATRASVLPPAFSRGWLLFESERGEKRRIAPVPQKWEDEPDDRLWNLCCKAAGSKGM
jgi:hypothetical protein